MNYRKMMKIQIFALSKPSKKITGPGIDQVDPETTPREILTRIAAAYNSVIPNIDVARDLIVDKTASIPRIALNDPVNEYFNGHQGDMYRIVDDSSTRFRMVAGSTVKIKTKSSPFHDVTADMYYSGYNTILDMLKDRRSEEEAVSEVDKLRITPKKMGEIFENGQFPQLDIKGIQNRRGQYMYVYFLQKDDETPVSRKRSAGAKGPFKALVTELLKTTVDHYNKLTGDNIEIPSVTDERGHSTQIFLDKIELVVVYNNQQNESLVKLDVPAQFFSVQQLVFNVTKHMDQPSFYLLDPNKDRAEIVDVLSLNGLILDKDKPLRDFNIKDGAKLILL